MNVSKAFESRSMKSMLGDHLLRNGLLSRITYDQTRKTSSIKLLQPSSSSLGQVDGSFINSKRQHKSKSVFSTMNKLVKGKLGVDIDKVFKRIFSVREGEKVLRASRCCLSTTAGPISGRLFISTEKIAFCSDRAIAKVTSPAGEPLRFHYKIVIPLRKIEKIDETENAKKPSQKYVQVVTSDNFDFWFMGFVSYKKTLKCLQQVVVSQSLHC